MSKPKNKRSSASATIPIEMLLRVANERKNPLKVLPDFATPTLDTNKPSNGSDDDNNKEIFESLLRRIVADRDDDDDERQTKSNESMPIDLRIECRRWSEIDESRQQWIIDLTERNMRSLYENSAWGWNRRSKQSELRHLDARFLLAYINHNSSSESSSPSSSEPIAFAHFRFEKGYANDAALYCYELQLEPPFRRRGIGKQLMRVMIELAAAHRMRKVLLTVLKQNVDAMRFYLDALRFEIDSHSPSRCDEDADYEILSLRIDAKLKQRLFPGK